MSLEELQNHIEQISFISQEVENEYGAWHVKKKSLESLSEAEWIGAIQILDQNFQEIDKKQASAMFYITKFYESKFLKQVIMKN